MNRRVLLEPAAETVCIENSVPPLIFELPPEEGRRVLERHRTRRSICIRPRWRLPWSRQAIGEAFPYIG